MVSVHSSKDNEFVMSIMDDQTPYWIGGNVISGTWVWSDSSTFTFTDWGYIQPNGDGTENCLSFFSKASKWHDVSCDKPYEYICRKKLGKGSF